MKALVMCLADPSGNPRPNRIIRLLASKGIEVDVVGFPAAEETDLPFCRLYPVLRPGRSFIAHVQKIYTTVLAALSGALEMHGLFKYILNKKYGLLNCIPEVSSYDLVIVQSLELLPFAFSETSRAKVVFDAREYYTREFEFSWAYRLLIAPRNRFLLRHFLGRCDLSMTVSQGLAREYESEFGQKMLVIRSVPRFFELRPAEVRDNLIRCVHHGNANADRGLGKLIEIIRRLDSRFTLDMYLVGSQSEQARLRRLADNCDRIRFLDPVPFEALVPTLNAYDVGFYYLEPRGFNLKHSLPNKFFEFIQARLAIAIGPSPDMAELVRLYDCGVIASDFSVDAMCAALGSLNTTELARLKRKSDAAARVLCWEVESEQLLAALDTIGFRLKNSGESSVTDGKGRSLY